MNIKVVILTEGGKDIGFGHMTRCLSICQAFEQRRIKSEFIINGDDIAKALLHGRKYQIFNWLKEKNRLFQMIKGASIAIVDSYLANERFYKKVSGTVKTPVYIDDNKRLGYLRGIVVNGNTYADGLGYPEKKDITYLLGSQYTLIRKEFWDLAEKKINGSIKSIMTTFGGDDKRGLTPKILRFLNEYYPECTKNVIIGGAFQDDNIRETELLKGKKVNLICNPDANKMKEIMLESDIAISAGGQTLYELARIGVPSIGICVADNQEKNLNSWQEKGFVEYIGWHNDSNLMDKLQKPIEFLENVDVRRGKSEIGKSLVDGKGSKRIAKFALSSLFKNRLTLRKATLDNARDILNLSNEKMVRHNSFSPERIEWDEHLKWLNGKLNSDNCVYFIVAASDEFYGQVRFDVNPEEKEAVVNISLTKNIRNLNLSSFLLNKTINEFLRMCSNIRMIKAYIKESNVASIKGFESANFKFLKDTIIKGSKAKLYIRESDYVSAQCAS